MLHIRPRLMGCLAGGLVLAASVWAVGQQTTEVRTRETRTTTTTTGIRRVSDVIGSTVRLQGGDQYGKIEDIVLNDAGCVEYIVIAHESGYVLVPWAASTVNYEERVITVDTTPQKLETLIFTKDNWPTPTDPQFTQRVQRVFGDSALRRGAPGGGNIPGREDPGGGAVRSRSTDRTVEDQGAPSNPPRAREVTPRATGRPAPDDPPRAREVNPGTTGRPAPGDAPAPPGTTPRATGRPTPGDRPEDRDAPTRPEPPRSDPRQP
jgi:hypothetical protein